MQSKLGLSSLGIWLLAITLMVGCGNEPEPMKSKSLHRFVEAPVISGVLSKDTKLIALLTSDQQISVWDTVSQKKIHSWSPRVFNGEINHVALSGNNRRLAVAGHWSVNMLNLVDGSVITSWDVVGFQASATVSQLHVDHTGHKVLVGMSDGAVLSVDLNSGYTLKLDHHKLQITRLAYDGDNGFAISGSTDKNFAYWGVTDGDISYQHNFRSRVTALAVDNESNKLFVSDALTDHLILDKSSGEKLSNLSFFERFRFFRHGFFVEKGKYLFTTSPKNVITLWDTANGDEIISWTIKRYTAEATVMDLSKNAAGDLVTLSSDGALQVWDYRKYL
ncbi:hypothetical protein GCM10008107_07990 [Psychrosphaera saromensis]|uniref:Uncharacterized protein n=1 Tax=Psychrosphaera saromensis TaxID=716813 RepID=A0A2S7UVY0_9GAMM|nr:WD40 repeat domain-containing protein [Psychrosphaera saromensis]PQJ53898.1 hypothetical protein BTO11_09630 [Psychrosphaera saromensis]GHB61532.1 hypothetical protein GCM10008107_07990 [Psychrosphaera saromensis]GLQ15302.1 hypothetical protein GCM10007917_27570 [Psychrosphaera saromensis]